MKVLPKNIWFLAISLTLLLIPRTSNANDIKQALNLNETTKGKSYSQYFTALREGEFLIDTNIIYVPARGGQRYPSIAFDGTNYLIIWLDNRHYQYEIFGARINPSGVLLDSGCFAISTIESGKFWPSVGFGDTNYLVVWDDDRNSDVDIYGARVSPTGILIDTTGIALSTANSDQRDPAVAFDGINYLVVWADRRNGNYDIYGARVTQSGVVVDPGGFAISIADNIQGDVEIVFDGTNYLVVWDDNRNSSVSGPDIYGARVSPSGIVLDTLGIAISTERDGQIHPSVAFDGTNCLVVWNDMRDSTDWDIFGARVSQSGVILDTIGFPIFDTDNMFPWFISVAFDSTNYLVTWHNWSNSTEFDVYGARVNTAGVVLDTTGIPISTLADWQFYPMVAFDGINYFVAWEGSAYGSAFVDVFGARVNQSGVVLDTTEILISSQANTQEEPSACFDGTNYLVVWEDYCNNPYYDLYFSDIYGTRVSPSGTILDPNGIAIATGIDYQLAPSVAFDNTNYFVVWDSGFAGVYDIFGARVSQSGIVIDTVNIAISTAVGTQRFSSIAFDSTNYLVVWQDRRSASEWDIYGTRVSQSGTVLDTTGIAISTAAYNQEFPAISFDGTNYLVVWQDGPSASSSDIYGTRVDQSGIVLDTAGVAISTAPYGQRHISVAFDGTNYMVVWQDGRNISELDIYGARVSQTGTVLDTAGIAISTAPNDQEFPSVAFDGTNYLVVWQDRRSASEWDLHGAKISTSGVVLNTYIVSTQSRNQISPALTGGNGDQILITYSGWADSINTHITNAWRIWSKFYPFIGIEEDIKLSSRATKRGLRVHPNPVQKECNIEYNLSCNTKVSLSVFDVAGRLVREIVNKTQGGGVYHKTFLLTNLPQGIYFIRLKTDTHTETKKVIFIE